MPGLDGLDLARVLARFRRPPRVVFVTAYDEHAVEAFDLRAVDYLLKPVRPERLGRGGPPGAGVARDPSRRPSAAADDETIAVELGGVTRFVNRSDVRYVEAQGDYARLHTADGSHLVRVPLDDAGGAVGGAGFVRIHRSHLVALHHVDELRVESGRWHACGVGDDVLAVSRRHTRELRDTLVRRARPGREDSR